MTHPCRPLEPLSPCPLILATLPRLMSSGQHKTRLASGLLLRLLFTRTAGSVPSPRSGICAPPVESHRPSVTQDPILGLQSEVAIQSFFKTAYSDSLRSASHYLTFSCLRVDRLLQLEYKLHETSVLPDLAY